MARKLAWSRTAEDVTYALPCTRYPRQTTACDIRGACAVNDAWGVFGGAFAGSGRSDELSMLPIWWTSTPACVRSWTSMDGEQKGMDVGVRYIIRNDSLL